MSKNNSPVLSVHCSFGGVSIGQETARVGVTIERSVLDLLEADRCFCGKRLVGKIVLGSQDDSNGQGKLIDDVNYEVAGAFDVKRLGLNKTQITTGLTFALASIDVAELSHFAKGVGRMIVDDVQELPDDSKDEFEPDDARVSESLKADGPWRDAVLSGIFSDGILKALHEAGVKTVGDLHDWTAGDKVLTDIPGIGVGKAGDIEERMLEWWAQNPQFGDEEAATVPMKRAK